MRADSAHFDIAGLLAHGRALGFDERALALLLPFAEAGMREGIAARAGSYPHPVGGPASEPSVFYS